jgi:hypothetical protein
VLLCSYILAGRMSLSIGQVRAISSYCILILCDADGSGASYCTVGYNVSKGHPSAANPIGNPAFPGQTIAGGANFVLPVSVCAYDRLDISPRHITSHLSSRTILLLQEIFHRIWKCESTIDFFLMPPKNHHGHLGPLLIQYLVSAQACPY